MDARRLKGKARLAFLAHIDTQLKRWESLPDGNSRVMLTVDEVRKLRALTVRKSERLARPARPERIAPALGGVPSPADGFPFQHPAIPK